MNTNTTNTNVNVNVIPLLEADDIEVRVMQTKEKFCDLLLYKNARCDQAILDRLYGNRWRKSYQEIGGELFCTIEIYDAELGEWIGRQDVGEYTDRGLNKAARDGINISLITNEPKSRASDAQKRAATAWGIGRELYTSPSIRLWAGRGVEIKPQGQNYFVTYDKFSVAEIAYDRKRRITYLTIKNESSDRVVFTYDDRKNRPAVFPESTVAPVQAAPVQAAPVTTEPVPEQAPEEKKNALVKELCRLAYENKIPVSYITKKFDVHFLSDIPTAKIAGTIKIFDKVVSNYSKEGETA